MDWRLYAQPGAWGLPSLDPPGIHAAGLLQLLHPDHWELHHSLSHPAPSLVRTADRLYPASAAPPSPLSSLGSPDTHLPPAVQASLLAYTTSLHRRLRCLTDHTLFSLWANWTQVTRPVFVAAYGKGSVARLWGPDGFRTEAKERSEEWREAGGAGKGEKGVWGMADGVGGEEGDEVMRRKAEGVVQGKKAEEEERKRGLKSSFDVVRLHDLAESLLLPYDLLLSTSSTPFAYSSPSPTSLDLALFSHLSLWLFPPWPRPLLREYVEERFPRLERHTRVVRDHLFPPPGEATARLPGGLKPCAWPPVHSSPGPSPLTILSTLTSLHPLRHFFWSAPALQVKVEPKAPDGPTEGKERRMRWAFGVGMVLVVGVFGYTQGTPFTTVEDE